MRLAFVESSVFTRRVAELGLEDDVRWLQLRLLADPRAGVVEPGTGGLRKLRVGRRTQRTGTRGGVRVHYLYLEHRDLVYLLHVYAKADQAVLSAAQRARLRLLAEAIRREGAP